MLLQHDHGASKSAVGENSRGLRLLLRRKVAQTWMTQMDQRIGPPLSIHHGATTAFESESLIEAHCLKVLLVDLGR